ncbi:galactose oxidase [Backusella circina FSU 941]|nr:galactose oxidase [Backusella circina FSU 941]
MPAGAQSLADLTTSVQATTGDIPPPLVGASTTIVDNKMYVFGGRLVSSKEVTNHLYILDLATLEWTLFHSDIAPRERYFHSCNLNGRYLVVFGGMSSQSASQNLCALGDICLFDLDQKEWKFPEVYTSMHRPQPRYAHLAVCEGDKLIIMGGQDMSNQYINEINVFDFSMSTWTNMGQLSQQYGAYRSVAFCPSKADAKTMRQQPFWEKSKEDLPLCVYSNYNFTDVTRDLQVFYPLTTGSVKDVSPEMTGSTLPPGLRFPSGDILGQHLILAGTYLTPSHHSFHLWALDLSNLVWMRIETGAVLSRGSWNRGLLYDEKQRFLVFGDKSRDLLEDYNHRQVNFTHMFSVDLEAFGIYASPEETCTPTAQELGLNMLNEPSMSDIEIITNDNRSIPANSNVIRQRWTHFEQLLEEKRKLPFGHKHLLFPESYYVTLAFLQFIYSDHLMTDQQYNPSILSRLLIIADMYHIPRLAELVTHALHQILTISTASLVYETAALTGRTSLQIRALRVMINAKKEQQKQQQIPQKIDSPIVDSPYMHPHHIRSQDEFSQGSFGQSNFSRTPTTSRRVTSSKSSTVMSTENYYSPSPKLSKSNTQVYTERPKKSSLPSFSSAKISHLSSQFGIRF